MDLFSRLRSAGPDEVVFTLEPSLPRRLIGAGALAVLGILLAWFGFSSPAALHWRVALVGLGGGALWLAVTLWLVSDRTLELTPTELREAGGRRLLLIGDAETVERGAFAFKPSNGFAVRTRSPQNWGYVPGLWWRFGRRVGVGGLTSPGRGKAMAEAIEALVAMSRGGADGVTGS